MRVRVSQREQKTAVASKILHQSAAALRYGHDCAARNTVLAGTRRYIHYASIKYMAALLKPSRREQIYVQWM
jgi:hypothetical protein